MEFKGTERYFLDPELEDIVNMAIAMEKPLLVTGEAGTGKTQLAFEIARSLKMNLEVARCKSTIKGEELCYIQDTVLRLNDSRFGSENTGRNVNKFYDYVIWGPIGRSFRADKKGVLLLDEIDKTDSDVQDNLLDVLDESEFTIREVNETIKANYKPITIITSNAKRELSDPFLRRCYCHFIAFPTPEYMTEIVNLHFPNPNKNLLETALNIFYELRKKDFEKPPATSELLNWFATLQNTNVNPKDISTKKIPYVGTLLKRTGDILKYRKYK